MSSVPSGPPVDSPSAEALRFWRPPAVGPAHRVVLRVDRGRALLWVWQLVPGLVMTGIIQVANRRVNFLPGISFLALYLLVQGLAAARRRSLLTFDDYGLVLGRGPLIEWSQLAALRVVESHPRTGPARPVALRFLGRVGEGEKDFGTVDLRRLSIPADILVEVLLEHHRVPVDRAQGVWAFGLLTSRTPSIWSLALSVLGLGLGALLLLSAAVGSGSSAGTRLVVLAFGLVVIGASVSLVKQHHRSRKHPGLPDVGIKV